MSDTRPRTNVSIRESVLEKARRLMSLRDFDNFSEFLSTLIREEWERRKGPVEFAEPNSATARDQRVADKVRSDARSSRLPKANEAAPNKPRTAEKRGQSPLGSDLRSSPKEKD